MRSLLGLSDLQQAALLEEVEQVAKLGTWVWNVATHEVTWSRNLFAILGYHLERDQPTVEALYGRVHPDDRDRALLSLQRARVSNEPQEVSVRLSGAFGEQFVQLRVFSISGPAGAVQILGTVRDVTEQRTLEREVVRRSEAVAEVEARWRSVVETPFDFVAMVDEEGVMQWVNHAHPTTDIDSLVGKSSIFDYVAEDQLPGVKQKLRHVFETGEPTHYETYVPSLDTWFSNTVGAYKKDGKVVMASIVARDVTKSRRVQLELNGRSQMLIEAERIAHVGSWRFDQATGRFEWSEELRRIFGLPHEIEPTREVFFQLVVEEDRERLHDLTERILKEGTTESIEYRIRRWDDGAIREVQTAGEVLLDEAGKFAGFIGATIDLTERKALENQVQRTQRLEALGRLAGGLAHDFNNVLTVILGQVELADRSPSIDSSVKESLATIRQASERASRMTQQLLAFARRQVASPRPIEPRAEIQSLVRLFQPLLGEDIQLRANFDEATWPVCIDPSQLEQLVMNLVLNARDAMEQGGLLSISTSNLVWQLEAGAPAVEVVRITVADTGSGMTDEVKRRAFDPFFTTKPIGKGTGLGLATCENIVRSVGGAIEVESGIGRGTSFHVYLPRSSEAVKRSKVVSEYPSTMAGNETILIVEDMALIRRLCARVLGGLGYNTLCAENAEQALSLARSHTGALDLVLTDMVLPDRSGAEVARDLLEIHPNLRVLFTSGYSEVMLPTEVNSRQQFLPKPYTPNGLSRTVRQLLDAE